MTFDLQGSIYQHGVVIPLIYTNHTGHIAGKKNMRMNSFRRVRDELVSDVMRGMSPERETVHA